MCQRNLADNQGYGNTPQKSLSRRAAYGPRMGHTLETDGQVGALRGTWHPATWTRVRADHAVDRPTDLPSWS